MARAIDQARSASELDAVGIAIRDQIATLEETERAALRRRYRSRRMDLCEEPPPEYGG